MPLKNKKTRKNRSKNYIKTNKSYNANINNSSSSNISLASTKVINNSNIRNMPVANTKKNLKYTEEVAHIYAKISKESKTYNSALRKLHEESIKHSLIPRVKAKILIKIKEVYGKLHNNNSSSSS